MSRARPADTPPLWRLGADPAPAGPHLALVPGAEAPLLPLDLPDRLRGPARERVAARQLAEALAAPRSALEFYPFAPGKAAFSRMIAVSADAARGWRAKLRPGCVAVLPDYLALPCIPQVWTLQTGGEALSARLGPEDGFTAEPDMALRLLARADPAPEAVLRLGPPEAGIDGLLAARKLRVFDSLDALVSAGAGRPLRWSAAAGGVDLGTPPSALYDRLGAGLARWRWPAAAAVLALAAYSGAVVLETRHLGEETARADALTLDLVRSHFAPEGPILDVRSQVQAAADAAARPEAVTREVPALIQLQQAAPMLTQGGVALRSAEYRADAGLVTAVTAADFAGLDALVAELRAGGFLVEVLDSRSQVSGGVASRLRLQLEPGR